MDLSFTLRPTPSHAWGSWEEQDVWKERTHIWWQSVCSEKPKPAPCTSCQCSSLIIVIASIYVARAVCQPLCMRLTHIISFNPKKHLQLFSHLQDGETEIQGGQQLAYGTDWEGAELGFEHSQADDRAHACNQILLSLLPSLPNPMSKPCRGCLSVPEALSRGFLPLYKLLRDAPKTAIWAVSQPPSCSRPTWELSTSPKRT